MTQLHSPSTDTRRAARFIAGFDRPNIRYRIALKHNVKQQLLKFLKGEHPRDAGIDIMVSHLQLPESAPYSFTFVRCMALRKKQ